MKPTDERLGVLFKQWRDIEPRADFEASVWRRIRTSRAEPAERGNLIEVIGRLLWQPAWSVAAALVIAVMVGAWGGIASALRRTDSAKAELQFLSSGTLTGSYLQMASKGTR